MAYHPAPYTDLPPLSHSSDAKKSQIAKLPKMHLDRNKLSIHVDVLDSRCNTQFFQFIQLARSDRTAKISKINR